MKDGPPADIRTALVATAGGVLAVLAAIIKESSSGTVLLPVVVAPVVEELVKPIGIIILLEKRPWWIRSPGYLVVCCLLGSLVFATIENLVYIGFYNPHGTEAFILFRLTVCTAMHLTCTFIFALGLVKVWRHIRTVGGTFDIDLCFRWFVAAALLHGTYNGTVFILQLTQVLRFD